MKSIEEEVQQAHFTNQTHKLRVNLLYTASWLKSEVATFLKPYGITQSQFNILRILRGSHPEAISTLQIREKMIDKMSDTSRLVDRLVQKGWLDKKSCTHDRRLVRVSITTSGMDLLSKIDSSMATLDAVTDQLSKDEVKVLNTLLDKLRKS